MTPGHTPARLLTRHFIRRFVDNDLLSAHVDRHESLAFFVATLVAGGTFGAVLLGTQYLFVGYAASWVAVSAMNNLFVIISVAMIVVALTAAAQWDALSLDVRDAAILGPLPIAHWTVVRAKAAADALLGLGVVAAAAIAPSAVFTFFMLSSLRLVTSSELRVFLSHVVATIVAGLFAFLAVLALREMLRLLAGERGFARVSSLVQVLVVVSLTTTLLLVMGGTHNVSRQWLGDQSSRIASPFAVPAMWFVALAQLLNGDVIALAPVRGVVVDDDLSRFYLAQQPLFVQLAGTGVAATGGTLILAAVAFIWTARRPPSAVAERARRRDRAAARAGSWRLARRLVRTPAAHAAYGFAVRVLLRSAPHRLVMAVGIAIATSLCIAVVGSAGLSRVTPGRSSSLLHWALQPLVLMTLIATLRHAAAVPAELRANWIFHQCWPGQLRQSLAGAAWAGFVVVAMPAVLVLFPLHLYVLGVSAALFHAMNGALLSAALLPLSMIDRTAPPFLSSYVRTGNVASTGPILGLIGVGCSFLAAVLERAAMASSLGMWRHTLVLVAFVVGVREVARRRVERLVPLTTEIAEPAPGPLGLSG